MLAARVAQDIREVEAQLGHTRTVLVGDLNMNPFDAGLVSSEALHAVMDKGLAAPVERTVLGAARPFFYNPMWSRLGDETPGPPGTHFFSKSRPSELFWHTIDQVLLRPALLPRFNADSLLVPTEVGGESLVDDQGRPSAFSLNVMTPETR